MAHDFTQQSSSMGTCRPPVSNTLNSEFGLVVGWPMLTHLCVINHCLLHCMDVLPCVSIIHVNRNVKAQLHLLAKQLIMCQ